jgi:hypothetical protein
VYLPLLFDDGAPPSRRLRRAANICRLDFQALSEVSITASLIHAREPRDTCIPPFSRRATQVLPRSSRTRSLNSRVINARGRTQEREALRGDHSANNRWKVHSRIYIYVPSRLCLYNLAPPSLSLSLSLSFSLRLSAFFLIFFGT